MGGDIYSAEVKALWKACSMRITNDLGPRLMLIGVCVVKEFWTKDGLS